MGDNVFRINPDDWIRKFPMSTIMHQLKSRNIGLEYRILRTMTEDKPNDRERRTKVLPIDEKSNRFLSNVPYAENQVYVPGDSNFNASWVGCGECPRRFIVCQAPLPHTEESFWRMIMYHKVKLIICLSSEEDGFNDATHANYMLPYWQAKKNEVMANVYSQYSAAARQDNGSISDAVYDRSSSPFAMSTSSLSPISGVPSENGKNTFEKDDRKNDFDKRKDEYKSYEKEEIDQRSVGRNEDPKPYLTPNKESKEAIRLGKKKEILEKVFNGEVLSLEEIRFIRKMTNLEWRRKRRDKTKNVSCYESSGTRGKSVLLSIMEKNKEMDDRMRGRERRERRGRAWREKGSREYSSSRKNGGRSMKASPLTKRKIGKLFDTPPGDRYLPSSSPNSPTNQSIFPLTLPSAPVPFAFGDRCFSQGKSTHLPSKASHFSLSSLPSYATKPSHVSFPSLPSIPSFSSSIPTSAQPSLPPAPTASTGAPLSVIPMSSALPVPSPSSTLPSYPVPTPASLEPTVESIPPFALSNQNSPTKKEEIYENAASTAPVEGTSYTSLTLGKLGNDYCVTCPSADCFALSPPRHHSSNEEQRSLWNSPVASLREGIVRSVSPARAPASCPDNITQGTHSRGPGEDKRDERDAKGHIKRNSDLLMEDLVDGDWTMHRTSRQDSVIRHLDLEEALDENKGSSLEKSESGGKDALREHVQREEKRSDCYDFSETDAMPSDINSVSDARDINIVNDFLNTVKWRNEKKYDVIYSKEHRRCTHASNISFVLSPRNKFCSPYKTFQSRRNIYNKIISKLQDQKSCSVSPDRGVLNNLEVKESHTNVMYDEPESDENHQIESRRRIGRRDGHESEDYSTKRQSCFSSSVPIISSSSLCMSPDLSLLTPTSVYYSTDESGIADDDEEGELEDVEQVSRSMHDEERPSIERKNSDGNMNNISVSLLDATEDFTGHFVRREILLEEKSNNYPTPPSNACRHSRYSSLAVTPKSVGEKKTVGESSGKKEFDTSVERALWRDHCRKKEKRERRERRTEKKHAAEESRRRRNVWGVSHIRYSNWNDMNVTDPSELATLVRSTMAMMRLTNSLNNRNMTTGSSTKVSGTMSSKNGTTRHKSRLSRHIHSEKGSAPKEIRLYRNEDASNKSDRDKAQSAYNINRYDGYPIVVHCSAGIGRACTLVALLNIVIDTRLQMENNIADPLISVLGTTLKIREERYNGIATTDQYNLIYSTLAYMWFLKCSYSFYYAPACISPMPLLGVLRNFQEIQRMKLQQQNVHSRQRFVHLENPSVLWNDGEGEEKKERTITLTVPTPKLLVVHNKSGGGS